MNPQVKQLLRQNNAREKALSPEGQAGMTDVVVYLRGQDLSRLAQEEIRRDILDMVLAGEARGQTMQQVIGLDYRTFCDEIVAAVPRRPRGVRMLSAVDDILPAITLLLAIWTAQKILSALLAGESVLWLTLTVGEGISLACIVAVAVGLVTYVCRTALNRPPVGAEERPGGLWKVFLLALVVFAALFLPRVILPQPLVTLWMPAAVVVTLLPLGVSALLDRRTDL